MSRPTEAEGTRGAQAVEGVSRAEAAAGVRRTEDAECPTRITEAKEKTRTKATENPSRTKAADSLPRTQAPEHPSRTKAPQNPTRTTEATHMPRTEKAQDVSPAQEAEDVSRTQEFEELRPLLFAIAYRVLGSVSEAEDAVQEAWLRYEGTPTRPASPKAFLSAVVTRISIDVLRSARVRRETYVGQWLPEPLLSDPYEDPARSAELADSVSMAALLLLERLSPLERAVFVLREVFGFGFSEVASAVGRSEAACRQLATRARRHMDAGRPRFEADRREREELAARFFDALREGDVDGLRELLAADVQMVGDGGGKAPQLARAVIGADKVAKLLAAVFPLLPRIDVTWEPHEVNAQPGAIFRDRDGKVLYTLSLDVLDGQIQTIRSVINPDKLGHVGPVGDAWAADRELKRVRRPMS